MKCPYVCNVEQILQYVYTYEEENNTFTEQKMVEHKEFVNCLLDECGAYVNGKCNYNQGCNG